MSEHYPSDPILDFFRKETSIDIAFLATLENEWWGARGSHDEPMGFIQEGNKLELHTWGWSGNEDIIIALQMNKAFWKFLKKEEAGGHYYFELKASESAAAMMSSKTDGKEPCVGVKIANDAPEKPCNVCGLRGTILCTNRCPSYSKPEKPRIKKCEIEGCEGCRIYPRSKPEKPTQRIGGIVLGHPQNWGKPSKKKVRK